jgi:hypothetical protein
LVRELASRARHLPNLSRIPLGLLTELTRLEGDADHARDLLRATSSGRSPASILAGHQIAERLGIHNAIEAAYVVNASDQAWMLDRPVEHRADLLALADDQIRIALMRIAVHSRRNAHALLSCHRPHPS